jgi:hypothetical protein
LFSVLDPHQTRLDRVSLLHFTSPLLSSSHLISPPPRKPPSRTKGSALSQTVLFPLHRKLRFLRGSSFFSFSSNERQGEGVLSDSPLICLDGVFCEFATTTTTTTHWILPSDSPLELAVISLGLSSDQPAGSNPVDESLPPPPPPSTPNHAHQAQPATTKGFFLFIDLDVLLGVI